MPTAAARPAGGVESRNGVNRALLLALALSAQAGLTSAQGTISFRRLPIPDEVPAVLCTALAQDRQGFLWIGTQSGLVRWDAERFRLFPPRPGAGYVRALLATSDGRVWSGSFAGGVSVYDPTTDTFTHVTEGLSHQRVEGLAEDRDGSIWVATQEGLNRVDPRTYSVVHFRHDSQDPESLADDRVRGLLVDRAGRLWVGSRSGLQFRSGARGFERVAPELARELVTKLMEDDRGRIWIGTAEGGAAVLEPRTGQLTRIRGGSHPWVYGIVQASAREVWIATFGGGIDVVDPVTLAIVNRLRHDAALPNTIGSDRVGAILRDRSGVVWIGTWGEGIASHDPSTRAFRTIRHSPTRPDGLSHPAAVRAMQMRDGTIWVGTNGNGIDILDRELRRIGGHRLDGAAVTCLAQGSDGTIWVATLDGALRRMRVAGTEVLTRANGLAGGPIRALTFGPDGALWAGSSEGLSRIDARGIRTFRHDARDASTLSSDTVEAIAFTQDGTMWVGTDRGLNVVDPSTGKAIRIEIGLPNLWIPDLMVDHSGRLWIATHAGACILESWDGKQALFRNVAELLRRPAAAVEALIEDDEGSVWLGPRLRVDPAKWTARELGPADGCEFRNFFIASRSRTDDGTLLFGSPEGLLAVRPAALHSWSFAPPVVATALHVDGQTRAIPRQLTLAAGERGFRVDFAALDFSAPQRNLYRYRLEGYDEEWTPADASRRSLTYTNLAPGRYLLRVRGTNRAGLWSPHELRLPVVVLPAFHQTMWFRGLCVAIALAIAYALYRLRVRQLDRRAIELERVVTERTAELAAANARIEEASLTDPLTGLRNRRFLEGVIASDLALASRGHGDLVVLLCDLDHFKTVNDTWGHDAGDAVLAATADTFRSTLRASDYAIRWGGEEMLAVVRFVDRRDAADIAEKVRSAIEECRIVLPDGTVLARTCSIGLAVWPSGDLTWQQVLKAADDALYEAKRTGRNRVCGAIIAERGTVTG